VRLVSTRDGEQLFDSSDNRYAVEVSPVVGLMDFGVSSALSMLELRDVTLARAEDEVSREIALRIPVSSKALTNLQLAVRARESDDSVEARNEPPPIMVSITAFDPSDSSQATPYLSQVSDPPAR
jgi:hypothetical protein